LLLFLVFFPVAFAASATASIGSSSEIRKGLIIRPHLDFDLKLFLFFEDRIDEPIQFTMTVSVVSPESTLSRAVGDPE
jgi:hypothetical protein